MSGRSTQVSSRFLEAAVVAHVATLLVGVSWAFGGNADWVRTPISLYASVGILLTLAIAVCRGSRGQVIAGSFSWMWPVIVLNALIAVSYLTSGFKDIVYGNSTYLMPVRIDWWRPSAAQPDAALRSMWLFDGIYFSCLNLALAVSRRHLIRIVLALAVGNVVALSVFGTIQKLVGSTGIYFGSVKSPQEYFFASFVYDNHWGAFAILMLGACIGLILRYAISPTGEGIFHGPTLTGLIAASLVSVSIPLSGSRACTLLLCIFFVVAVIQGSRTVFRALRLSGATPVESMVAMAFAVALAMAAIWTVSGETLRIRAIKTKDQVAVMWAQGGIGSRSVLYHDTWRMARERMLFGWGMGSFPTVFSFYNTQESKIDHLPIVYHDAHSDWIQSVAEIGIAGTLMIGVAALLPILSILRFRVTQIPFFLLAGCSLIVLYAWVEFPFGNVAVVLAWWLCFFSAIQYVRLTGLTKQSHR